MANKRESASQRSHQDRSHPRLSVCDSGSAMGSQHRATERLPGPDGICGSAHGTTFQPITAMALAVASPSIGAGAPPSQLHPAHGARRRIRPGPPSPDRTPASDGTGTGKSHLGRNFRHSEFQPARSHPVRRRQQCASLLLPRRLSPDRRNRHAAWRHASPPNSQAPQPRQPGGRRRTGDNPIVPGPDLHYSHLPDQSPAANSHEHGSKPNQLFRPDPTLQGAVPEVSRSNRQRHRGR